VDHIYACAFVADRSDLLNDKFAGVASYTTDNRPCVVDALCNLHDGIIKEVKAIREHWWRRRIRELFDQKVHISFNILGLFRLQKGHVLIVLQCTSSAPKTFSLLLEKNNQLCV
jgi:hypothetical protein